MPKPEEVITTPEVIPGPQDGVTGGAEPVTDPPETPTESPVMELNVEGLTIEEDGTIRFLIDPNNPEGTVYTGKTIDEVLLNMRKGVVEKDTTIHRMKENGFKPTAGKNAAVPGSAPATSEFEPPDDNQIAESVLKEMSIDPAMLAWTKEQWKEHEVENGAVETIELRQKINQARSLINQRISEENVLFVNNSNLEREVNLAVETLVEFGLSPSDIDLDEVIENVNKNMRYWQPGGMREPGAIINEVTKVIAKKVAKTAASSTERKISLRVNNQPKAPSSKASQQEPLKPETKAGQRYTTSDAHREVLQELEGKGRK